uniref:DUF834 domain-containing protein n=2 Tax=Oryza sativa subsp. japonica TaxID=39947 RepID=Q5GM73_ORYSJ|nr:hypothetical protein [Oryza sativa Japonica Group]BAD89368.1 hypothetical protein [Oryza sativa Japonica Group]
MVGGEGGRAAEVPLTTAHLTAATASGGDDGGGAATMPKTAGGGGELGARGDGATVHGRAQERLERGGAAAGGGSAGPAWAARERERSWAEFGPTTKEGDF